MSRAKDPTELAATEPPPEMAATATADPASAPAERGAIGARLERGTAIGKYTVLELLGEGGMGVVYAAYDPDLDRKVALKLLRRSHDQAGRARLLREAQAMARLTHPNVITVYEVGTVGDRDFIAMEFVDGQTVEDWLAAEERDAAAILEAFVQAGRGLAAAHRAGLVHRDFKPSNALVDREHRVRVTDFGLARRVGDGEVGATGQGAGDPSLTHTGAVLGTPAYMAPEQHEGRPADTRSDQFCFCVALYEALHGERPFVGDTFDDLRKNVMAGALAPEPSGTTVSGELRRVLVRGLARDPADRYGSMEELLAELERRPAASSRKVVAAAVLAALATLGGIALLIGGERDGVAGVVCGGGEEQLVGVWDEGARGRVRTAFAMAGTEGALGSYERLEVDLDEYAGAWIDMYRDTCEDTHVREVQSEQDLVLRMKCLQDRRGALAGLSSALEKVDPRRVDDAVKAVHELPRIAACGELDALRQGVAPPAVAVRDDVELARSALDEARSLGEVGRLEDAVGRAEALRDRAVDLGYAPLIADVYNVLGDLYWRDQRVTDAEAAFTEAEMAAEEAGHDEARATALIGMTRLLATTSSRFEEAERYGRRARAAIARSPARRSELSVDLSLALVQIARNEGRVEDALAILDEIADSLRLSPLYESRLHASIGDLRIDEGDIPGARAALMRAASLAERELGENHSETIQLLAHLSVAERLLANYDAADALEDRLRAY